MEGCTLAKNLPSDLAGKSVLVTGAGAGIGRAAAVAFGAVGARVVVAGRREDELAETLRRVRDAGGDGAAVVTDIRREADVERMIGTAVDRHGGLHCAFNNAGVFGRTGRLADDTAENWDEVIGTNLTGTWLCMKLEIAAMLRQGGGTIVNCSSVSGVAGHLGSGAYTASKHGVVGLTRSASLQYARRGIRINVVCPGSTDTEMLRSVYRTPEELARRADLLPIGRLGLPEEVAAVVLWLCSDASSFVTGQVLCTDGGVTAGRGERIL
jgi:NAD(P)-dependent dehydrogenase (short-subunit alcohol dehydrogenase family)